MHVPTGEREATCEVGGKTYSLIHIDDFPEHVFREFLNRDPEVDDTRSQVLQIRLPNGDLILGFFPQGDTYFEVEEFYT